MARKIVEFLGETVDRVGRIGIDWGRWFGECIRAFGQQHGPGGVERRLQIGYLERPGIAVCVDQEFREQDVLVDKDMSDDLADFIPGTFSIRNRRGLSSRARSIMYSNR